MEFKHTKITNKNATNGSVNIQTSWHSEKVTNLFSSRSLESVTNSLRYCNWSMDKVATILFFCVIVLRTVFKFEEHFTDTSDIKDLRYISMKSNQFTVKVYNVAHL